MSFPVQSGGDHVADNLVGIGINLGDTSRALAQVVVWQGDDIFVGKAGTHRSIISDDELMLGWSVV